MRVVLRKVIPYAIVKIHKSLRKREHVGNTYNMIHYHGLPITSPSDLAAIATLQCGHAFVSFNEPSQLGIAIDICQSFAADNGAFSFWKSGSNKSDWSDYYSWVSGLMEIPGFDFAVIPDVIDGTEEQNDLLVSAWPHGVYGAPVWHMNESIGRFQRLTASHHRVCIGSSGDYSSIGTRAWWDRIHEALNAVVKPSGGIPCKLHGLRMLNPEVFKRLPFSSADSCNIARNIGIDSAWNSSYKPTNKQGRAAVMRQRIESYNAISTWTKKAWQGELFYED